MSPRDTQSAPPVGPEAPRLVRVEPIETIRGIEWLVLLGEPGVDLDIFLTRIEAENHAALVREHIDRAVAGMLADALSALGIEPAKDTADHVAKPLGRR